MSADTRKIMILLVQMYREKRRIHRKIFETEKAMCEAVGEGFNPHSPMLSTSRREMAQAKETYQIAKRVLAGEMTIGSI